MKDSRSFTRAARPAPVVALVCALIALQASACDSGSKATSSGSQTRTTSSAPSTVSPTGSQAGPSGAGTGQPAAAGDVAAIKAAYATFFSPKTSLKDSEAVLQDGPAFRAALAQQAKAPQAKSASAAVSTVRLQSPNTAMVTFTLFIAGAPLLTNTPGYAVREDGKWKVAGATFCGLLVLNGGAPPACNTPQATALPK